MAEDKKNEGSGLKNWTELKPDMPAVYPSNDNCGPDPERIKNIEVYHARLHKRFSDPRILERIDRTRVEYEETGDVNEVDFRWMWNLYVGSSRINNRWNLEKAHSNLDKYYNQIGGSYGG